MIVYQVVLTVLYDEYDVAIETDDLVFAAYCPCDRMPSGLSNRFDAHEVEKTAAEIRAAGGVRTNSVEIVLNHLDLHGLGKRLYDRGVWELKVDEKGRLEIVVRDHEEFLEYDKMWRRRGPEVNSRIQ